MLLVVATCVAFLVVGGAAGAVEERGVPEDRGVSDGLGVRLGVTVGAVGVGMGDSVEVLAATAVGVLGISSARPHAEAVSSVAATAAQRPSRRTVTSYPISRSCGSMTLQGGRSGDHQPVGPAAELISFLDHRLNPHPPSLAGHADSGRPAMLTGYATAPP
ncbi:hypothetical protein [Micromonospora sp. C28ISP2-4]|uniref:hypothetical protein n=1 Tax=Micromonospora sp. C28ISP2-4 TaxID=3059523 RepID=UPI0026756BB0|nr:hypothetical protein [Micromonospora sp. C28ISP2-4]MDO3687681.1 hypothetical protein [Micromonospora sp. C28ISP2-4]